MADSRGGPRVGIPGNPHPNRTDQNLPAIAPTGGTYGTGAAALQSQQAQPLPNMGARSAGGDVNAGMPVAPGEVPGLGDPTARPDEPVTAGLASGPGPGPEALPMASNAMAPEELSIVRGLYKKYRHDSIRQLLEFMESRL